MTDNAEEAIRGYQNSTADRSIIDRIQDEVSYPKERGERNRGRQKQGKAGRERYVKIGP